MEQQLQQEIISLQTQVAFQDNLINEMNLLLFRQQEQIDLINHTIVKLHEKISEAHSNTIKDLSEETPPPHY